MIGHILPDTQNAPRGVGLRIFNVTGPKMNKDGNSERGKDGGWHDMFGNNAPVLEVSMNIQLRGMIGYELSAKLRLAA